MLVKTNKYNNLSEQTSTDLIYLKQISLTAGLIFLITFFLIISFSTVRAEKATVEEMNSVCHNWLTEIILEKGSWAGESHPKILNIIEITENDTLLALCYNIDPDGFIIVPTLKDLPPIKVYTDEGYFDMNDAGFPQMIKEILLDRTRVFISKYGSFEAVVPENDNIFLDKVHRSQWDRYAVREAEFTADLNKSAAQTSETVGPLLTTRWHQNAPYNNFCPMGYGGRTVVGCVATATAQIFAYHQWPPQGDGSEFYFWAGDYSCSGYAEGGAQTATFTDDYDWANIPNSCSSGCTTDQQNALAELNYEVGVAFHMDYGACGSAIYLSDIDFVMQAFHEHFRYLSTIDREDRSDHTPSSWFNIIKNQINSGYPIQYFISRHSIVCDGWQIVGDIEQYHMNYGWGGSYNAWYTLDNTYCNWEGCTYLGEFLLRNIIPDKGVMFTTDTTLGWAPFEVNFQGISDLEVEAWSWDFGDGEYSAEQSPTHIYNNPGTFDVILEITTGGENITYTQADYIIVLADTLIGSHIQGPVDDTVELIISANNNIPLQRLQIPVEFSGPVTLTYKGYSTEGCRTASFEDISYINYDANNNRLTLNMEVGTSSELEPGSGPVIKLLFQIDSASATGVFTDITFDGYNSYIPCFYSFLYQYEPFLSPGSITYTGCCLGLTGNVDCSENDEPDISDITRLIDYLYIAHDSLCCPDEADCNASGGEPDISDITALIDFLYLSHQSPVACP